MDKESCETRLVVTKKQEDSDTGVVESRGSPTLEILENLGRNGMGGER